eukprot:TRINITY_DN10531_c0_g1_i1.p1 TRINITY_DN10531_c0_g1~~TRINITY_DN10531_c0_g1_i1.p1  ORF type:complete len:540 (+),score=90.00 TRINITY_DN10531_c0_g1_i1:29-1621(+)
MSQYYPLFAELYLQEDGTHTQQKANARSRTDILTQIGEIVSELLMNTPNNHKESKLWLANTFSQIVVPDEDKKSDLFMPFFGRNKHLTRELLLMVCQHSPATVGAILKSQGTLFRQFFADDESRIKQWFAHFHYSGKSEYGARALERYVFDRRDSLWSKLVWTRKAVPPCVVVQKRSLFLQLDVVKTVRNMFSVAEFWDSDEFRASLSDGSFLDLDVCFFVETLISQLDQGPSVHAAIRSYLKTEKFGSLCSRLFVLLSDADIVEFLSLLDPRGVSSGPFSSQELKEFGEYLAGRAWNTVSELLLFNALAAHSAQVVRLLREDEILAEKLREKLEKILLDYKPLQSPEEAKEEARDHWALRREIAKRTKGSSLSKQKFLLLESFLLRYRLGFFKDRQSIERILSASSIKFQPVLLPPPPPTNSNPSASSTEPGLSSPPTQRRSKKSRRKRSSLSNEIQITDEEDEVFIGWTFTSSPVTSIASSGMNGEKRGREEEPIYDLFDIVNTLVHKFFTSCQRWFAAQDRSFQAKT